MCKPCPRTSVNHVSGLDTQREREQEPPNFEARGLRRSRCGLGGWLGLGFGLLDLDQVAAGVVEDGGDDGAEVGWGLDEVHAFCHETLVFGLHVVDGEGGAGDAVLHKRVDERTDRGMAIRLKQKTPFPRGLPGIRR